jgi:hypothetical protein
MAVGTDQLALCDLLENRLPPEAPQDHVADFAPLCCARKVIPLHGGMVKDAATVSAGVAFLQTSIPGHQLAPMLSSQRKPASSSLTPVLGVVLTPARLAPRLEATAPSVELLDGMMRLASSATPRHVAILGSESDADAD